jgi:hypothetical protein
MRRTTVKIESATKKGKMPPTPYSIAASATPQATKAKNREAIILTLQNLTTYAHNYAAIRPSKV